MVTQKIIKKVHKIKRSKSVRRFSIFILVILAIIAGVFVYRNSAVVKVDRTSYGTLLETIAHGESRGNYNAYFGKANNNDIKFTEMTLAEILTWQEQYVEQGSVSSAVGKYQIIRPTLLGLIDEHGINKDEYFDEYMQDKMAILLLERRGSVDYVAGKITANDLAANLAKEWAALPKVSGKNPEESYYASDGINKAHITIPEIQNAVKQLKKL